MENLNLTIVYNGSMPLSQYQMTALYIIFSTQITGSISNIICILFVTQLKSSKTANRPKLLMANIAFSDTLLTYNTLIPCYLIIKQLIKNHQFIAHLFQSFHNYLDAISLYSTSITFTIIGCDRYYAITKVFNNPFDNISTKILFIIIWLSSILMSVPFIVTNDVDYFDFTDTTLYCINDGKYLFELTSNRLFIEFIFALRIIVDFLIPTILVSWFSVKIIFRLFDYYRKALKGIRVTTDFQRCEITKRLIAVLFIFIIKNTAYYLATAGSKLNFSGNFSRSCDIKSSYNFFYVTFRTTNSLNSVIFFWLSSQFRLELKNLFEKKKIRSRTMSLRDTVFDMNNRF